MIEVYYSKELPEAVEVIGARRKINYNIRELTEEELMDLYETSQEKESGMLFKYYKEEHKYAYYSLTMGGGRYSYSGVVEAIIREKYSADEMEAITNNMAAVNAVFLQTLVTEGILAATQYLKDSVNEINSTEFKEMQEWRRLAKDTAKKMFGM